MLSVEWNSAKYHTDGRRRSRPTASTVHGWLAKMRGTLIGNESLRRRGIREMREARAIRQYKKEKATERKALERDRRRNSVKGSGGFAIFGTGDKGDTTQALVPRSSQRSRRSNGSRGRTTKPNARPATGHKHSHRSTNTTHSKDVQKVRRR